MIEVELARSTPSGADFMGQQSSMSLLSLRDSVPDGRRSTSRALLEVPVRPEIDGLSQGGRPLMVWSHKLKTSVEAVASPSATRTPCHPRFS